MARTIKVYAKKRVIAEYSASDSLITHDIVENEIAGARRRNVPITKITVSGKTVWTAK